MADTERRAEVELRQMIRKAYLASHPMPKNREGRRVLTDTIEAAITVCLVFLGAIAEEMEKDAARVRGFNEKETTGG